MKKSVLPVVLLAVGLAIGVGLKHFGSVRSLRSDVAAQAPADEGEVAAATSSEASPVEASRERIEAMRKRIAELESMIAARKNGEAESSESATETEEEQSSSETESSRKQPHDHGVARLEQIMKLKREDPRQFVSLTNRMDRTARWQQQQQRVRVEFFKRADVSKMTDDERAVHEELIECEETLGRIGEIGGVWDRSAEVENELVATKNDIKSRLTGLYQAEARTLLRLNAQNLGYGAADAEEIAESVSGLLKATYNENEWIGVAD